MNSKNSKSKKKKRIVIWSDEIWSDLLALHQFGYIEIIPHLSPSGLDYEYEFRLTPRGKKLAEKIIMNLRVWEYQELQKLLKLSDEEIDKLVEEIIEKEEKQKETN